MFECKVGKLSIILQFISTSAHSAQLATNTYVTASAKFIQVPKWPKVRKWTQVGTHLIARLYLQVISSATVTQTDKWPQEPYKLS